MKIIDTNEYKIAGHYLSALINDDYSGLSTEEEIELIEFTRREYPAGAKDTSWTMPDNEESASFERCDVCKSLADCYTVHLLIYG